MGSTWVGLIVGSIVGLAGVITPYLTAASGRRHERDAAHVAWHRDRRGEAYLSALRTMRDMGVTFAEAQEEMLYANVAFGEEPLRIAELEAAMEAYATEKAFRVFERWKEIAMATSGLISEHNDGDTLASALLELDSAREELARLIRAELAAAGSEAYPR